MKIRLSTLWSDEEGQTTISMAVAILVSLALVFTSAQTYRINSASADIQEVADIAALAAEGEVAEFMVAVRLCDATVLSLTLLSLTSYGLGIVALLIPPVASLSAELIEFGSKIMDARNSFAEKATEGLNTLQNFLPFLATASAAAVAAANNGGAASAQYFAVAMLVPPTGTDVSIDDANTDDLRKSIDENADDIRKAAEEAEAAAEEANEAKQRGFERDCGDNPSYCMYERAGKLAGLTDTENPLYQSVDTWSFSVALRRAQVYYAARYANETPMSTSVEEQANSVMRKRFYAWASDQLAGGYVNETDDSFSALFPHLYSNTAEMRETTLYDEAIYPVTSGDAGNTMHAWSGCPEAAGATSVASIRDLEEGTFITCESCGFTAESLGKVSAASTSIDNGFEYHYAAVAQAAEDYGHARETLDSKTAEAKKKTESLLTETGNLAKNSSGQRIQITPAGSAGAVALVVDTSVVSSDMGFASLFVNNDTTLGARAAVSGATLVEDTSDDGSTVITSLLDSFGQDAGAVVGAARIVLDCWSGLLSVYSQGQSALTGAIESGLNSLPLISSTGLGTWAADTITSQFESVGLQPADLDALKPVSVNTSHVTATDSNTFSVTYRSIQQSALAASSSSTELLTSLADFVESEAGSLLGNLEGGIQIAEVTFPIGNITIPITLTLPSAITDAANDFVGQCIGAIRSLSGTLFGIKEWS